MPGEGIALNVQMVLLIHKIVGGNATSEAHTMHELMIIPPLLVSDTSIRAFELPLNNPENAHLLPLTVFCDTFHAELVSKTQIELLFTQTKLGMGLFMNNNDKLYFYIHRVQHHHVTVILTTNLRIVFKNKLLSQISNNKTASFT